MSSVIKQTGGEFARFFVVGVGATLLHLLVYWLINVLFNITEAAPLALNVSYLVGYGVSFIANYIVSLKWTFKTQGSMSKGVGFAFSHAINAGMHVGLLNVFSRLGAGSMIVAAIQWGAPWLAEWLPILSKPEAMLPLPVYVIVVPVNFLLVRFFLKRGDA